MEIGTSPRSGKTARMRTVVTTARAAGMTVVELSPQNTPAERLGAWMNAPRWVNDYGDIPAWYWGPAFRRPRRPKGLGLAALAALATIGAGVCYL